MKKCNDTEKANAINNAINYGVGWLKITAKDNEHGGFDMEFTSVKPESVVINLTNPLANKP